MTDHIFYQHGDEPDAANFAQAHGSAVITGYIVSGLALNNYDNEALTVDVTDGVAVVYRGDYTTASPNIDPNETRTDTAHPVEKDAETGRSLTANTVNHVYLDLNTGVDDTPEIVVNDTGTEPNTASLKIGEVDTANDTVHSQWHLIAEDGTLTYPDVDSLDKAAVDFREGTVLYERDTKTQYEVI